MDTNSAVQQLIRERVLARRTRERAQLSLLAEQADFHETIRAKLEGLNESKQFANFSRCGNEKLFRTCRGCRSVEALEMRCNLKWCPKCQWRIVDQRKKVLALWTSKVAQPKHLVLTERNWPVLTRTLLRSHGKRLAQFRRGVYWQTVRGGCVSIEVTNEGNGWHVHSHWLVDADWLDMHAISRAWGRLAGQHYAICKIKDVRNKDYLKELCKYVCDGSEMAKWKAEQLNEFVTAIRGRRFFFAFGSLFKEGRYVRAALNADKPPGKICECGCEDFVYESEIEAVLSQIRNEERRGLRVRREPKQKPPKRNVTLPSTGTLFD